MEKGEALSSILKKLEERQIIRSALLYRAFLFFTGQELAFQAGTYYFVSGQDLIQLTSELKKAQPVQIRVTIPEGMTLNKIAKILDEKNVLPYEAFIKVAHSEKLLTKWKISKPSFEGYLFPDTYNFSPEVNSEEVIEKMVTNFFNKVKPLVESTGNSHWEETVILASIVEREYQINSEASIIASVFTNRLKKKIPLASCATIEYIITEIQEKPHPKRIYFNNTLIQSPYNTYLHKGLPPTPICNPGITALKAAFLPASTDYLFFVVDNQETGSHKFSNSFTQHEKAREDYLNSYVSKN